MGVSVFPPAAGGGESSFSNFAIDLEDYSDNTVVLSTEYPAGGYVITSDPVDASMDFYLLNSESELVGYSSTKSITASAKFSIVVVLGGSELMKLSFTFVGETGLPSSAGAKVNAGAYIVSANPLLLPSVDDTTVVTGGNFALDVAVKFVSGETEAAAKSVVRSSDLEMVVTRPDDLDPALNPWSLQATNPGVPVPVGSNVNKIQINAGAMVVWVTTSPLPGGQAGTAYSTTLEATDDDGIVSYSIGTGSFPGLTLDSSTGVLSGTPTGAGNGTLLATDSGGNVAIRDFSLAFAVASGGIISDNGGFRYHRFNSSGTFTPLQSLETEFLVVGGGGGGGNVSNSYYAGGGGGGGFRTGTATIASTARTVTIGSGGSIGQQGGSSSFEAALGNPLVSLGGGFGGGTFTDARKHGGDGASGGGGAGSSTIGAKGLGTSGQGNDGAAGNSNYGAGGGGAGSAAGSGGNNFMRGTGLSWEIFGIFSNGGFGATSTNPQAAGVANTGDAGGSYNTGGSGCVIIKYAI
jgi:hypothetical protein